MLQKIKEFIIKTERAEPQTLQDIASHVGTPMTNDETRKIITEALAHYCAICRKGFKTRAACSSHKSLKHKHE